MLGSSCQNENQNATCVCVLQGCPAPQHKTKVLKDMIFPLCEKLGQTIIFVRTRETARALHAAVSPASLHLSARMHALPAYGSGLEAGFHSRSDAGFSINLTSRAAHVCWGA